MTVSKHPESQTAADISAETPAAAPETAAALDPLAALEAEKAELKDKLLRTLAEMENLRRRTEREVADSRLYAVTSFARDMLSVADNLRRALDSVPAEVRTGTDEAVKALIEGVDLTERGLIQTLERHGVKKREPVGEKFNPNFDQAMFEIPDDSKPNGTVVQVVQAGYVIGERVLRPSMVGVSKAAPKPAEPTKH